MTLFYPDLSSYQGAVIIQPGTALVVAKATEGDYYTDAYYAGFKVMAAHMGSLFSGYHFLKAEIDPAKQAQFYHSFAGNVPCMLDVETEGLSKPGVDWCLQFIMALERLGGRVWGVYYPKWYWDITGGNLGLLEGSGAVLVSSGYEPYSDTSQNWNAYGGATPRIWQYTDAENYSGYPCDFNAFKGTLEELSALVNGTSVDLNTQITFSPAVLQQFPELASEGFGGSAPLGTVLGWMAARIAHLVNQVGSLQSAGGVNPVAVADAELAEIKAKL